MEQEKLQREKDEAERKVKEAKIKDQFGDANPQWEHDKEELRDITAQHKPDVAKHGGQGAAAKAADAAAEANHKGKNP